MKNQLYPFWSKLDTILTGLTILFLGWVIATAA